MGAVVNDFHLRSAAWIFALFAFLNPLPGQSHGPPTHDDAAPAETHATSGQAGVEAQLRALVQANPKLAAKILAEHERALAEMSDMERRALTMSLLPAIESTEGGFAVGADTTRAKVVVVDFFDYHCGSCKRATHDVLALAERRNDIRFVFKELPVLSDESRVAARAALAARAQGRYLDFHTALMSAPGLLSERRLFAIAAGMGMDVEALRRDMNSAALDHELDTTIELAQSLGIQGTPAFFVNGELLAGRDPRRLGQMIDRARNAAPE